MDEAHEDRNDADHDQAEQRNHEDALESAQIETSRVNDCGERKHPQTRRQRRVDDHIGPERADVLTDDRRDANALAECERIEEQQREGFVASRPIDARRAE